jgi:hypothetical protein
MIIDFNKALDIVYTDIAQNIFRNNIECFKQNQKLILIK